MGTVTSYTKEKIDLLIGDAVTQQDIDTAIANLVDTSPAALDTLNELAAALGDDANFSATITNSIANEATTRADSDLAIKNASVTKVSHGADATVARPADYGTVIWVGSVAPNNGIDGDFWSDTT